MSIVANAEVACVVLRDPEPIDVPMVISTREGSRIRARRARGDGDSLMVSEPLLGPIELPQSALGEINWQTTKTSPATTNANANARANRS